tara:strand:+ start:162 stop:704 length:543 start_codon:yes stop_codon:yes gene_type:complete
MEGAVPASVVDRINKHNEDNKKKKQLALMQTHVVLYGQLKKDLAEAALIDPHPLANLVRLMQCYGIKTTFEEEFLVFFPEWKSLWAVQGAGPEEDDPDVPDNDYARKNALEKELAQDLRKYWCEEQSLSDASTLDVGLEALRSHVTFQVCQVLTQLLMGLRVEGNPHMADNAGHWTKLDV